MGQELVKFNGATGIVERPDNSLALRGLTPNQERLRELINGKLGPEDSRFYHPPRLETNAFDRDNEFSGHIAHIESFSPATDMVLTDDPKACWTGFAFGIACAAVIGGAFFLSIAAVVTPQPSIAALVPIEVEQRASESNQVASRSAVVLAPTDNKQLETASTKIATPTIWQELRRFHASAGKFSQPRILLVSSPAPKNLIDGVQLNERKASLSKQKLEPVALVEQTEVSESSAEYTTTQLMPRIIDAVSETVVPKEKEASVAEASASTQPSDNTGKAEPKALRAVQSYTNSVSIFEDTVTASTSTKISGSAEILPSEPVESSPITTAGKRIKVIKSSLRPTARTKVRLPNGRRRSIVGSKARKSQLKAAKLAKKKRAAQQNIFFKIQIRPNWAKTAFSQSNQ